MDLVELGRRIRRAREQLGYSQEAFAHLVDKDQTSISEYENGKRKLSITDIPQFAQILEVPIAYFFEGEASPSDLDRALLDEFHQLSDQAKPYVISVVRTLVQMINTR